MDANGKTYLSHIADYEYDPWGRVLSVKDSTRRDISNESNNSAAINPFRYRGYYYDAESGFYYLQSRYYDPVIKRFINADSFASTGTGYLGCNMFAYCLNNPIICVDRGGFFPINSTQAVVPKRATPSTGAGGQEVIIDGKPYNYVTDHSPKGELEEYWFDKETDILKHSRHHSTHGNSKNHKNPHDHDWFDDDDNNHRPGPPIDVNPSFVAPQVEINADDGAGGLGENTAYVVGGVAAGYLVYQGIKWIAATIFAPMTCGGSYAIAFATP